MITDFAGRFAGDISLLGRLCDKGKISLSLLFMLRDCLFYYLCGDIGLIQVIFLLWHHADSGDFGLHALGKLNPFLNCSLR
jgi:hypothetical protein